MVSTVRKSALFGCLLASSALASPAIGQQYTPPAPPPIRETIDENGVDLTRGTVVARAHSVSIGGPGTMGLSWSRSITQTGGFRDSTGIYLSNGSPVTVTIGSQTESFTLSGGNYTSVEKTGATLTTGTSGRFIFTDANGVVYTFAPWPTDWKRQYSGTHFIESVVYPTGEKLTFIYDTQEWCVSKWGECDISYGVASRLGSVEATNGYKLVFAFQSNLLRYASDVPGWVTIASVQAQNMSVDPASQSWPTLTMNGVTSFTDSLNRTTTYTFTSGNLTGVKRPGASSNSTTYSYSSGKVNQVVNEGVTTNYSYADVIGVRTTTISDAAPGNRVLTTNLSTMQVTSDTNEAGKTTAYEYEAGSGLLKKVTAPEGNFAEFEYDGRGNLKKTTLTPKSGSGLSSIYTSAAYPDSDPTYAWKCATGIPAVKCNKPLTTTDALGNVTEYSWDDTTGQPTVVTLPEPATNADQPQTRYSYSSYFAQYRNAAGTLSISPLR